MLTQYGTDHGLKPQNCSGGLGGGGGPPWVRTATGLRPLR